jgi:hypothetical protein
LKHFEICGISARIAWEKYTAEAPEEAVELFRKVIHESDHLLRLYPVRFLIALFDD